MVEKSDLRHDTDADKAVSIAFHAAANALSIFDGAKAQSLDWPMAGDDVRIDRQDIADTLAGFVRGNPTAPAEALFRYARGQDIHGVDPDAFAAPEKMASRVAYQIFVATLGTADRAIAAERAAEKVQAQATGGLIPAAALAGSAEGTVLEQQPDPLAKSKEIATTRTKARGRR